MWILLIGIVIVNGMYTLDGMVDKNSLWEKYGYLVRKEALRLQVRLPPSVELDDLIQAGSIGFINAIDDYDPKRGIVLASWITQRIRWALMDELRERDWVSRRVRNNAKKVSAAIQRVEQHTGNAASESEIAAELGITLQEYQQILSQSNSSLICSLDEMIERSGDTIEPVDDCNAQLDPLYQLSAECLKKQVSDEIKLLPKREQLILSLYYHQEFNMKEVSVMLGITETRVSQIHSQIMKRLRARLLPKK